MFKYNMFIIIVILISTLFIVYTIEKHSVHPIFGNYTKFDSNGKSCHPWEACR